MTSIARSGWHRAKTGIADEIGARYVEATQRAFADSAEREAETLRQLSDMFRDLAHVSVDIGAISQSVAGLRAELNEMGRTITVLVEKAAAQAAALSDLRDIISTQIDVENQTTEVLGRILQSARARLDSLEEAAQATA